MSSDAQIIDEMAASIQKLLTEVAALKAERAVHDLDSARLDFLQDMEEWQVVDMWASHGIGVYEGMLRPAIDQAIGESLDALLTGPIGLVPSI